MRQIYACYAAGVALVGLAGFFSPVPELGYLALGAGAIYAAHELVDDGEDDRGDTA
jgi:hypothetical protein